MAFEHVQLKANSNGYTSWGGNPPQEARAADGCVFRGYNVKRNSDGTYGYAVYRIWPDHTYDKPHADVVWFKPVGQASIHAHQYGYLFITYFMKVGDGQDSYNELIPEYVRFVEP